MVELLHRLATVTIPVCTLSGGVQYTGQEKLRFDRSRPLSRKRFLSSTAAVMSVFNLCSAAAVRAFFAAFNLNCYSDCLLVSFHNLCNRDVT